MFLIEAGEIREEKQRIGGASQRRTKDVDSFDNRIVSIIYNMLSSSHHGS
jgi:hypothetical protein